MAYGFSSSSSQSMVLDGAAVNAAPLTIAVRAAQRATATANRVLASVCINTGSANAWLIYDQQSNVYGYKVGTNGSSQASNNYSPVTNTYYSYAAIFDTNSVQIFWDKSGSAVVTDSVTPNNVNASVIGAYYVNGALSTFANHNISEVAVWSVKLLTSEIDSLAAGFKPYRVRPQSLVLYCPLVRNANDIRGNKTITQNNSPTVETHPRVY